jgi:hypothetical protein
MPENIPKFIIFVAQIIPIVGLWHWFYHMILIFCPILQDTSRVPQVTPLSTCAPQMLEQRHLKVLHQILSTAWNRPLKAAVAAVFFMGF